jgi:hypothetical protein
LRLQGEQQSNQQQQGQKEAVAADRQTQVLKHHIKTVKAARKLTNYALKDFE